MTALTVLPILMLPMVFALHRLERWALRPPTTSRPGSRRDHERDGAPEAVGVRRPESAE